MTDFSAFDYFAVACFFLCWVGYNRYSENAPSNRENLNSVMAERRSAWMSQMLERDNRMVDVQILRGLSRTSIFFASTSILVIAGLIAVMGASDVALALVRDLPLSDYVSREVWETKVLILILVFIYAFFKFGWAMRQLNYCMILVGAVSSPAAVTDADRVRAARAAMVSTVASKHSNRGIRAYYFGLALLAWHIHPLALIASTFLVVLVLYRREFNSRTLRYISTDQDVERTVEEAAK